MANNITQPENELFENIRALITAARQQVVRTINTTMVITYFHIGRTIIEYNQDGKSRADYAAETLKNVSEKLSEEFGRGFSTTNLEYMRNFYSIYKDRISQTMSGESQKRVSPKSQTVSGKFVGRYASDQNVPFQLSWSHYVKLLGMEDEDERNFYEVEAVNQRWSVRELNRQTNAALYQRLALSRDKDQVKALSREGEIIQSPQDVVKDPLVLEFLGLKEHASFSESDLEAAIINKLQEFMLELGKGFSFVGRQVRLSIENDHFYTDLVFYNRFLRCHVLIDLKIGKLTHQDLGQMQMYVNFYDRVVKIEGENPTIGIVLCREKNDGVVKFTLPEDNEQIFASKYKLFLPTKEEFKKQLESFGN
ncbi:MAG: DUF1016 domain-containing protein [Bacteroidia bacterium]|nr:DUF1016 domain-containing protein [Bacteroidia bacterium]